MVHSIARTGDRTYCRINSDHSMVKFHVANKRLDPETSFYVAEKAMRLYEKKFKNHPKRSFRVIRFNYAGRYWKIVQANESKWYEKILRYFRILFFHKRAEGTPKEYKIERAWFGPLHCSLMTKKARQERKEWKKYLHREKDLTNYKSLMDGISNADGSPLAQIGKVSPEEYHQGIRGKAFLNFDEIFDAYEDPFTKLATWAFQRYENHATAKDGLKPKDCQFRIIQMEDTLLLVHKSSPLVTKENMQKADSTYRAFLESEYGVEKINYINYLYHLNMENPLKLTPEHIFRVNCGTMNLEVQDIKTVIQSLKDLRACVTSDQHPLPFIDFVGDSFPKETRNKIYASLSQESPAPTMLDFTNWIDSKDSLENWVPIFSPTVEDMDKAFSGRKIYDVIQGFYAGGEWEEFKPWADQQELSQISSELMQCASLNSYFEKLSHIIVKKHLAKIHPNEGVRVGTLIPAPPSEEGGLPNWFQVTSCSTNRYNYSYTLEHLSGHLPAIKLYRNTASCGSAIHSSGSIKNDLSLLNPPGYMGLEIMDKRERAFFNQRTIPLWVGYHYRAEKTRREDASQVGTIYALLKQANQALWKTEQNKCRPMKFREILKKHDVILNEFYFRNEKISDFKGKKMSPEFLNLFKDLVSTYIHVSEKKANAVPPDRVDRHAAALIQVLETISPDEEEREQGLIKKLIKDLNAKETQRSLDSFNEMFRDLDQWDKQVQIEIANGQDPSDSLNHWLQALRQIAEDLEENVEVKIAQDIAFVGQSLGGALAQASLVFHLTKQERIPLPEHSCWLYEFDSPAIQASDNKLFKRFGNQNKDLLNDLNIKFGIFRRQEVGDIVVAVGEEHLGAVFSHQEAEKLKEWLKFDAAINQRLKTATQKDVARVTSVHETLFLEGQPVIGKIKLHNKKIDVKVGKKKADSDYITLKFDPHIQGIFNSHGKKGEIRGHQGRKVYNYMNQNIWKITPVRVLNESFRSSTDATANYIRRMIFANRKEDRHFPKEVQDKYGRVYVTSSV